jgi:prolyl-tRNA editing enzyme YbaK/EbsC (Cys-tRNA(Pro) deacylase)
MVMLGSLEWVAAASRPDLLADPVREALGRLGAPDRDVFVAEIDPELADTRSFCETYGIGMEISANCVVVAAKRAGRRDLAACVVLATTRADVNGLVRRHLDARKASFAPMELAVAETGMEYGGITPIGLPDEWPLLVDTAVAAAGPVVVGSGVRRSKLLVPGSWLGRLPGSEVLDSLGI